jgi:hypothetical protein
MQQNVYGTNCKKFQDKMQGTYNFMTPDEYVKLLGHTAKIQKTNWRHYGKFRHYD